LIVIVSQRRPLPALVGLRWQQALEVDPDTGVTDIVGYWVVDDVGTVINPLLLKGQIMGAWEELNCCYELVVEPEVFWRLGGPPPKPREAGQ